MPNVPHHSTLPSQEEIIRSMIDNPKVPEKFTEVLKLRLEEVTLATLLHSQGLSHDLPQLTNLNLIAHDPGLQGH